MTRRKRRYPQEPDENLLAADVCEAMGDLGWRIPQDEAAVAKAEAWVAQEALPLPDGLREPGRVFSRLPEEPPLAGAAIAALRGDEAIGETLARAAREGGELPSDVEETMRRDREAAEREADGSHEG
jgi:hypothetical protein